MHAQDSQQARHRASGGRGYGRETGEPTSYTPPSRDGGRHRAPDAPSTEFAAVPTQQRGSVDSPPAGFRSLPSDFPTTGPASGSFPTAGPASGSFPMTGPASGSFPTTGPASGAVPTQRASGVGGGPRQAPAVSRSLHPSGPLPAAGAGDVSGGPRRALDVSRGPQPSAPTPAPTPVPTDEPVTIPVRRTELDRTPYRRAVLDPGREDDREAALPRQRRATEAPASPTLRPLAVRERAVPVRPGAFGTGTYGSAGVGPARPRTPGSVREPLPWERPTESRLGLVGIVVGAVGTLLGLLPWSGLLPRVMPSEALGSTPLFSLVGALCGVAALGVGAFAMFRADRVGSSLLLGVGSACLGAAAVVVGLTL